MSFSMTSLDISKEEQELAWKPLKDWVEARPLKDISFSDDAICSFISKFQFNPRILYPVFDIIIIQPPSPSQVKFIS